MKKITFITALIAISFAFNLNAQFTIDPAAEYYIYSNGVDEAGAGVSRMGNNKYIYPASATEARWVEIADADIEAVLPTINAKWKFIDAGEGLVMFQSAGNGLFIARGNIPYVGTDGNDASVNALVMSEAGDGFIITPIETAEKRGDANVYSITFVSGENTRALEVNHGEGSAVKPTTAVAVILNNTIQINNNYAERARFHWVIKKIDPNGVNVPNDTKEISSKLYFDILGKQVTATTKGLIIEKITYVDGSQTANKFYVK